MNKIYIYEGDFISLLQLINYLIEKQIRPFQIKNEEYALSLLDEPIYLKIDTKKEIIKIMLKKLGNFLFYKIYCVFLSEEENKELTLYYFILNAYKYPQTILKRRNLKCVTKTLKISSYVSHEAHKIKGFLRFRELKSKILYAQISPTNNILFLITNHFQKRLANEFWIIKDVSRKIYAIYDKKKILYVTEEEFKIQEENYSNEEITMTDLWVLFYQTTGIEQRKNNRCRMNFMPKKYWKYMQEVQEECS